LAEGLLLQAYQQTLAGSVALVGIGLHTGGAVEARLGPAPADAGIVFVRADASGEKQSVRASPEAVRDTRLGTAIGEDPAIVCTIEHLMAAFAGLGVDNALVEVDGGELPILDGSSAPFVAAIGRVGLRPQSAPRRYVEILETIEVGVPGRRLRVSPADRFELSLWIDFPSPIIGRQHLEFVLDEEMFRTELAQARTFGFLADVERLHAAGLARGASLDNTVVIDGETIMNEGGLRRPDEFVRHKALDVLGDLYLGGPILGRVEAECTGHALNNALLRRLAERPEAWRLASFAPELAKAG
jgi:UDP-3-O-[3-hydroxymyristoyl] N-acetylglucosamine deacetylase